jgi:hypothetical protein
VMRRAERRAWAALPARRAPRTYPARRAVIHTDRLFAACAGQWGRDRGQAPPKRTGTVQRGNKNVPHERSRPAEL